MTELAEALRRQIAQTGPLTVAEYMTTCLLHPRLGYYTTRDPLGANGDFVTAPEISQMFGELIGLALAQSWLDRGAPSPFVLAELGPGRGTLMADLLRATKGVPGFHDAAQIHLVEASHTLRARQRDILAAYEVTWVDAVDEMPPMPLFLVANEFFDCLPIRQFLRDGDGWRERVVTVQDDMLVFALTDATPLAALNHRLEDTHNGDLVETCAASEAIACTLGERISTEGGVALIIDYGSEISLGDTFQAVRAQQKESPLAQPGEADLTAHVDFGALARNAAPATASALVPQGVWLERLGIVERARSLASRMTGAALENHIAGLRRLTHPDEMGTLFRIIALHDGRATPPGLEPAQ
ncbi:class I SAM-dependent methyltransferase [Palleronia caenipelagi]|uniref:Class I SAM-dependent methyltransferase n=1 Tax=Palleronia caenipelagi TaxID=2489174 RepID=A0A547Q9T2_9RHOB|nr:SAM-dependent methyltransferase [Palleronia caenipelagi]TRD23120.1 class I SAM-dependent methyltransferase [Palleronia caenipelagi]